MGSTMSKKEQANEGLAAYVGIGAPETPRYLLANNFLLEYFEASRSAEKEYSYAVFTENGTLHTEDEREKEELQRSFDCFLRQYLGENSIREGNRRLNEKRHYYFPVTPGMLVSTTPNLRHMLFYLQNIGSSFDFEETQELLKEYIFQDHTGINYMIKILMQNREGKLVLKRPADKKVYEGFWSMLTGSERNRMEELADRLNEDLHTLLTHPYFGKLDFYRRYNYLAVLLTSYVLQYIVCRRGKDACMLCQGAPRDNRLSGAFHRAACGNYADIRALFPRLLTNFYTKTIKNKLDGDIPLHMSANEEEVFINGTEFNEFLAEVSVSRRRTRAGIAYEDAKKAFGLEAVKEKDVSVGEFVMRYINMTGTRKGSVLTKISSTLPTSGRQIDMVFPQNRSNKKYFAMSETLAEFYVRLYLARKGQQYDYLDHFIEDLEERYRIVLVKSARGEKALKRAKLSLPAQEYAKNKRVFLDLLNSINCLIKLSDSGYVITLPEEKGDFKLL